MQQQIRQNQAHVSSLQGSDFDRSNNQATEQSASRFTHHNDAIPAASNNNSQDILKPIGQTEASRSAEPQPEGPTGGKENSEESTKSKGDLTLYDPEQEHNNKYSLLYNQADLGKAEKIEALAPIGSSS